jgi:hypothetical protein
VSTARRQLEQAEKTIARAGVRHRELDHAAYVDAPVRFAGDVLGVHVTEHQEKKVLAAIARALRVAVAAGHRTGRTMAFAIALLWWCCTRPAARALLSTPSHLQMRATIWRQLGELIRNAKQPLGAEWFEMPSRGVQFASGNEIIGIASDTGERLQGFASANLLVVVDEAAGYPENLFPSLMSNLAGGGRALVGGNPTKNTGTFAECFTKNAERWTTMHISALDVARSSTHAPGLATPEWCAEMLEEHGAESIVYRARVLGEFSEKNDFAVFSLLELEQAQQRFDELMAGGGHAFQPSAGPLELGVDVARTGSDWTVAIARRGQIALAPEAWKIPDLVAVADRVLAYALKLKHAWETVTVRVDGVGVGAGVVDVLKRAAGLRVVDVQAAAAPQRDAYTNVRSEATFVARDWLRAGGCFGRDTRLEGEMAALTYCFDQRNKLKILGKDELRRQLGRSTDRFDALALAVYVPKTRAPGFGEYAPMNSRRI